MDRLIGPTGASCWTSVGMKVKRAVPTWAPPLNKCSTHDGASCCLRSCWISCATAVAWTAINAIATISFAIAVLERESRIAFRLLGGLDLMQVLQMFQNC